MVHKITSKNAHSSISLCQKYMFTPRTRKKGWTSKWYEVTCKDCLATRKWIRSKMWL